MRLYSILICTALVLIGCSRNADKLYSDGMKAEEQKEFQRAADLYEEVVASFPSQAYAESSLVRLSILYNNDLKDTRKALHSYQRFYAMFPQSKQAPSMLFLAGFLYNNEMHQLDSARMIYESFLQKYPEHELATSAKFELETLGKDPGQALNTQVAVTQTPKVKKTTK